jgi:hypothetical protein
MDGGDSIEKIGTHPFFASAPFGLAAIFHPPLARWEKASMPDFTHKLPPPKREVRRNLSKIRGYYLENTGFPLFTFWDISHMVKI